MSSDGMTISRTPTTVVRVDRGAERLVCLSRMALGFIAVLLCVLAFLLGRLPLLRLVHTLVVSLVLIAANGYRLGRLEHGRVRSRSGSAALVALDAVFVLTIVWFTGGHSPGALPYLLLMGGYCAVMGLTMLYHSPALVAFSGTLSLLGTAVFIYAHARVVGLPWTMMVQELLIGAVLVFLVAIVARHASGYFAEALEGVAARQASGAGILARLPQMVFTLDRDGKVVWSSPACIELLGEGPPALVGRHIRDLIDIGPAWPPQEGSAHGVWPVRGAEDAPVRRYVECTLWRSRSTEGPEAWEGVMADVTDRERGDRERQVMLERLHRYQKMESLGTLAGGMAHDFNNVLQRVADGIEMAARDTAEESTRRRMRSVQDDLAEARALVTDLLSLGASAPLTLQPVTLQTLIGAYVRDVSARLKPGHQVRTDMAERPLVVRGDPGHLRRVLDNLVGNALDAMPGGGVVTISCEGMRSAAGSEDIALVRVSDTGVGIPAELVDRVFDPFVTTKGAGKGTGLGLALVQHLMNLHKGSVSIERTGPGGTVFRLEFPCAELLEVDHDTRWMQTRRQRTRVLVIDDDPRIREVLKVLLRDLKYEVSEGRNAVEAAAELERHRDECRVAVMDWKLDHEEPAAVIGRLRAIRPDLIVIVVSGYAPDTRAIEKLGIQRWFTKPYDRNLLDLEIQRALYLKAAGKRP